MSRLGDTRSGERQVIGTELRFTVHSLLGQQAVTAEVWSLAPTTHPALNHRRFGKAADTEAVWALDGNGVTYWVTYDHRTGEVLAAVQSAAA